MTSLLLSFSWPQRQYRFGCKKLHSVVITHFRVSTSLGPHNPTTRYRGDTTVKTGSRVEIGVLPVPYDIGEMTIPVTRPTVYRSERPIHSPGTVRRELRLHKEPEETRRTLPTTRYPLTLTSYKILHTKERFYTGLTLRGRRWVFTHGKYTVWTIPETIRK